MEKSIKSIFLEIIVFLCLVLCCSACAQKTTWQEQYDLGIRYLSEGNYEEAIVAFSAAIEIDPKRSEAYLARADAYAAVGNEEAAEQDRAIAQKLDPDIMLNDEQTEEVTEPNRTEVKQLKQMKTYFQGDLKQVDTFYYDEEGRLVTADIEYQDGLDTKITCTYVYDSDGRLIVADRADFWIYFFNEEYIYNNAGQLIKHKQYWGGSELPYHEYDFKYDSRGRIESEQISMLVYDVNEYQMQTGEAVYKYDLFGRILERIEQPLGSEDTYITKYAYDIQDRLSSKNVDGYETTYNYDYQTFVVSTFPDGSVTLWINDIMGHEIWSQYIGPAALVTDDEGYIISAVTDDDFEYEFAYGESDETFELETVTTDAPKTYADFLKQKEYEADWSGMYTDGPPTSYSLVDINQDGQDELILVGDEWIGFCRFLIYGLDVHNQIIRLEVWENSSYTLSSCYDGLQYSPEHCALVLSETKPTTMDGGWGYYTISESGTKLDTQLSVGWEGEEGQRTYYRYSGDGMSQISEADKEEYWEELQPLDYLPLP